MSAVRVDELHVYWHKTFLLLTLATPLVFKTSNVVGYLKCVVQFSNILIPNHRDAGRDAAGVLPLSYGRGAHLGQVPADGERAAAGVDLGPDAWGPEVLAGGHERVSAAERVYAAGTADLVKGERIVVCDIISCPRKGWSGWVRRPTTRYGRTLAGILPRSLLLCIFVLV